jgi:hypothetical protein
MEAKLQTTWNQALSTYGLKLNREFDPSTFKYVKNSHCINSIFESYFRVLGCKVGDYGLYLKEEDDVIDEKMIENDLAVVSKDFLMAFSKQYDKGQENSKR